MMLEKIIKYIAKKNIYNDGKKLLYTCRFIWLAVNIVTVLYIYYKSNAIITLTGIIFMFMWSIAVSEFYWLVRDRICEFRQMYMNIDTVYKNELREIMKKIQEINEQE